MSADTLRRAYEALGSWTSADGERVTWAQALALREARIVRMQDFSDPANALRAIRA